MKYRVKGAIRDTGEEIEIDVTATSDYEAMAIASKLKLLVESVEAIIQSKMTTVAACQECGVVIEPHGVLRVIGEGCFCPDCYLRRVASAANSAAASVPGVKVTYNKFDNATKVATDPATITKQDNWSSGLYAMQLYVAVQFHGRTQMLPCEFVTVSILFGSYADTPFPKKGQPDITLWFDGYRLSARLTSWFQQVKKEDDGESSYLGSATFLVWFPIVAQLARATEIECRMGDIEIVLTNPLQIALGAVCQVVKVRDIDKVFLPPLTENRTATVKLIKNATDGAVDEPMKEIGFEIRPSSHPKWEASNLTYLDVAYDDVDVTNP